MISCLAIIVALMIAFGINISDFFKVYEQINGWKFIADVFTISIFIIMMILILKYAFLIVVLIFELLFDKLDGNKSTSIRRASGFINQLLMFAELPKNCHKVNVSNKDDF